MCKFNDEDISHDPKPFSTVTSPSGPSGSSEPQDSITANPLPKQSWEAGPTPKNDNPQKRKRANVTGEPEELENSPLAKRVQTEQQSIPTPVKTPLAKEAPSDSSSPLQRPSWDSDSDMPGPSARTERSLTPPQYPSPSFNFTPRPVRDIANSTHTRITQQSSQEQHRPQGLEQRQYGQGIPDQGVSGPSHQPENVSPPLTPLKQAGKDLILILENVHGNYRDYLIQLVLAGPQDERICSADSLCLYHSEESNELQGDHKRYRIKINWPQVTSGEGAGRTADVYHVSC